MRHLSLTVRQQRGVVLVVALVLLVMLTLFAVSAIRSSTIELQIVGNEQIRKELASAAQEAIELRLNSMNDINILIGGGGVADNTTSLRGGNITIVTSPPRCIQSEPIPGTSMAHGAASSSEIDYWEVAATATDTVTGGSVMMTQGFKVRMPLTSCP